jgi:DNA repair exonuclease SbcCD ATPase subunit
MKNLPSFQEFNEYDSLFESASSKQVRDLMDLKPINVNISLHEGKALDLIKNNLSKFFLGKYSKLSVIDQARQVLTQLEIDLIEKKNQFEDSIEAIESQIDEIRGSGDKQRLESLIKDKTNKIKEFESYEKTANLKIKKAKDIVRDVIDGNPRRRKYYEAGRSEDEISIAELQYNMAKNKSDESELKRYEDKVKKAKKDAEQKVEELKSEMQSKDDENKKSTDETQEKIKLLRIDPEKEKKKITSRKGKDILDRIEELETSIVKLRTRLERKLNMIEKRAQSSRPIPESFIENKKLELLSLSATIDAQRNLLSIFRKLGKTERDITKKLLSPEIISKVLDQVNKGIDDGQNVNTGLKRIISSIFTDPKGKLDPMKIKSAKEKIDK